MGSDFDMESVEYVSIHCPMSFRASGRDECYPAVPLFSSRPPCGALIFFALTLLCPLFSSRVHCCALIFLRTLYFLRAYAYPAVPLFFCA